MAATIVARSATGFTMQVEVPYKDAMLDAEEAIQDALNQAGVTATAEALGRCDANGKPIVLGDSRLTSKGRLPKQYQTPYGVATVARHVYQSSRGGRTFCPLDRAVRIVVSSTPRFAKVVAHKYAEFGSGRVLTIGPPPTGPCPDRRDRPPGTRQGGRRCRPGRAPALRDATAAGAEDRQAGPRGPPEEATRWSMRRS